jgi:hypothetical protein
LLRPWTPANSNYCSGEGEDALTLIGTSTELLTWNDAPHCWTAFGAIFEFSADCNDDGIVDYGQILDGTYPDTDGNGVPDCCDAGVPCDCPADITGDGRVDAADLGVLLAVWNTDGGTIPEADINRDGTVNASDLGLLLGSWGLCS